MKFLIEIISKIALRAESDLAFPSLVLLYCIKHPDLGLLRSLEDVIYAVIMQQLQFLLN